MIIRSIYNLVLAVVFFIVVLFGLGWGVSMNSDGTNMVTCPLMNHELTLCPMTIADYIRGWRLSTSVLVPEWNELVTAFFAIIVLITVSNTIFACLLRHQRYKNYLYNARANLFSYIALLFSQGILHAKIYA